MSHTHNADCEHSKGGRPSKYNETWIPLMQEAMKKGYTIEMFCYETRIAYQTFHRWLTEHPEFCEAFKASKKDAEAFHQFYVLKNLENKNLQVAAVKLFMQNCFGWSDKKETESNVNLRDESDRRVRKAEDDYKA